MGLSRRDLDSTRTKIHHCRLMLCMSSKPAAWLPTYLLLSFEDVEDFRSISRAEKQLKTVIAFASSNHMYCWWIYHNSV